MGLDAGYDVGAVHRGLELLGVTGYVSCIDFSNDILKRDLTYLPEAKPPLELAIISENTVSSYSFYNENSFLNFHFVDTVFYSVPEELVGKSVIVKKYHDEIKVYYENREVCRHKRAFGNGTCRVNIYHYPNMLHKKPGAVKNSSALRQILRVAMRF